MLIETAVDTGRSLWRERVARSADAPFLVGAGRTWTFGQADNEMRRIATGLAAGGVAHGTRVLVGMENRPETMLVHAALRELGAVLVPLLGGLTFAELAFQIRHSEAEVLIADEAIAATVLPHLDECPGVRTSCSRPTSRRCWSSIRCRRSSCLATGRAHRRRFSTPRAAVGRPRAS